MIQHHRSPEQLHYNTIEKHLQTSITSGADFLFDKILFENELRRLWETYHVPYPTLQSFIRNLHVIHVKRRAPSIKTNISDIIQELVQRKATILELSRKWNFPPYLLTRNILEATVNFATFGENKNRCLSDLLRDPHLLNEVSLFPIYESSGLNVCTLIESQIQEALDADPMYGLQSDKSRHLVGIEYEVVLEHYLNSMNIPFESEAQLRDRGTSKTPDVLLKVPIGIEVGDTDGDDDATQWKMICWIDSKALFGDIHTHRTSVLPQAQSYVHRFGPGLVIYWFGHAPSDRLEAAQGDITILGWDLPQQIMLPSGATISSAGSSNEKGQVSRDV